MILCLLFLTSSFSLCLLPVTLVAKPDIRLQSAHAAEGTHPLEPVVS